MDNKPPILRDIAEELREPGYFVRARERAQRRKSSWNLLLIVVGFGGMAGFAYLFFQIMWRIHIAFYPEHVGRLCEFWSEGISARSFISSFLLVIHFYSLPYRSVSWLQTSSSGASPQRGAF
jgi:hypothetical protein